MAWRMVRSGALVRPLAGGLTSLFVFAALLAGLASASPPTVVVVTTNELNAGSTGFLATLQAHAQGSADSLTGSGVLNLKGAIPGRVLPACTFSVTGGSWDGSVVLLFAVMDTPECADFWHPGTMPIIANPSTGSIDVTAVHVGESFGFCTVIVRG